MSDKENQFATDCIHGGQKVDPSTGAATPPVYLTSTYIQESPGKHKGYEYSRSQNPTRDALQAVLARLESADRAFAFASGCAAASTVMLCLNPGDHVIAMDDLYGGTRRLFEKVFSRFNIGFSFVDLSDLSNLESNIRNNTKLIWVETPTNPTLRLVDLLKLCEISKSKNKNICIAVDNTFATPVLQKPHKMGADLVVHSATKYLGGHADVVLGVITSVNNYWSEQIAFMSNSIGGIAGPMDAYLVLRGIKTLDLRLKTQCKNAQKIAEFLEAHRQVEKVYYPGLKSHPQFELAKRQMKLPGAMISFVIKGGLEKARKFTENTQLFKCAESLGGVESLISMPALMTHLSVPAEIRLKLGIVDGLIRLSVGVEDPIDLLRDLEKSFT